MTTQPAYLRFPHLHGELAVFAAEDDVWAAPLDGGGRAWRISADDTPVGHPRISPDGVHVAWTSTRDGAPEVHTAPLAGGPSRRLTYWGSDRTSVRGWTAEGEVLAVSAVNQAALNRSWAHAVPLDGGPSRVLPYGPVGSVAPGPDGRVLLLSATMGRDAAAWKRYRGGTAGKLWIGSGDDFHRIHADLDGNLEHPLWVGDRIAFLSDHEGTGALYSSSPDGADLRRHTPVGPDTFYARHAATDGVRVVYASAGRIWLLDDLGPDTAPRPLDIRLGGQRTDLQPYPVRAEAWLRAAAPDHSGRGSAVLVRGGVHWVTHREGPARTLAAEPGVRARLPRTFRADGEEQVVWVTDAEGEDALEFAPAAGRPLDTPARRIAGGRLGRVTGMAVAPDGGRIAVAAHDGRVLLVERESGEVREVDRGEDGEASGLVFSPDSGWLAWSHAGPRPLRQLRLARLTEVPAAPATTTPAAPTALAVTEATPLRFRDFAPAFTLDGKHLAFLSERSFDPVYDSHVFDLSFLGGGRPHLIPLLVTTPSPFGPQRHGRPAESGADKDEHPHQEGEDRISTPVTRIDLEGLADRIVPFPVEAAHYTSLRAARDGLLWLRHPVAGTLGSSLASPDADWPPTTLERYDLTQRKVEELRSDVDWFTVTGDGKRVLVRGEGKLRLVPADRRASAGDDDSDAHVTVDLDRVRRHIEPAAEWRQMYEEAGRIARDQFWRADMGGHDWQRTLDRYRPLLDRIATHDDLVDLLWEVQGELGTSHAYVTASGASRPADRRQGLLGADLVRTPDGRWSAGRVLPAETSDPHGRSPLAAPGVAVRAGDVLLAVDGRPVDPVAGPGPLLVGAAGKPVELTVAPAGGGEVRHVVVVPLADEEPLRYHDWVAGRRAHVRAASDGRLGYLHVPDMMAPGWAQLHRDLRIEMAREGLVVDVRENRGGHTSQLVVEKLARRIVGWSLPRDQRPYPYPEDAPRGPVVVVADEFSGSDGDIVNAAIRARGIGPVVGVRTWGGVIGIDNRYGLVDGTRITTPKYSFWLEGPGFGVENHGVEPDVEVVRTPADHAAGRDPQLDEAVRLALAALAAAPAKTPPGLPAAKPAPGKH